MSEEKSITEIVTWWGASLSGDDRRGLIAELFRREQARLDRTAEQAHDRIVLAAQADTAEHHLAAADELLANAPMAGEQLGEIATRHAGAQWHLLRAQALMLRATAGVAPDWMSSELMGAENRALITTVRNAITARINIEDPAATEAAHAALVAIIIHLRMEADRLHAKKSPNGHDITLAGDYRSAAKFLDTGGQS